MVKKLPFGHAVLSAALLLAACGGGQRGPTAPTLGAAEIAFESFTLLSAARSAEPGRGELELDEFLSEVARRHSEAMRDRSFFGHLDPSGDGLRERLGSAGVAFSAAAENLIQVSHGADPAAVAHGELMASPGHRANILDPRFRKVGVGVARQGDLYWVTQIFLAP